MSDQPQKDAYREKFRPDADAALDREVEAALGGMSIESLMEADEPQKPAGGAPQQRGGGGGRRGPRMGRIISVQKDHAFVDLGGKDQGIVPMQQFEQEPAVGQEMEFVVERYDASEGLLILNRKGALAQNVSWESLEIGQLVEGEVTGMNKGGLELKVKSMRAFMPAGQ